MNDLRKAAEMGLEALEIWEKMQPNTTACAAKIPAIQALRQALAQLEWVWLTDLEIIDMAKSCDIWGGDTANAQLEFAATLQAKLKEKNT